MARDLFHQAVRNAPLDPKAAPYGLGSLEKDGWTITDDPFKLVLGSDTEFFIDLAAERLIVATKENEKSRSKSRVSLNPQRPTSFMRCWGNTSIIEPP
jgi:hypothetical protein